MFGVQSDHSSFPQLKQNFLRSSWRLHIWSLHKHAHMKQEHYFPKKRKMGFKNGALAPFWSGQPVAASSEGLLKVF